MTRTTVATVFGCSAVFASVMSHADDVVLFRDDFNGKLNRRWVIVREDVSYYSLTSDYVDLRASQGDFWEWRIDAKNVFLIDTPISGDFSITMRVIRFVPNDMPYTQIELLAYDDDDNHVRCGYNFIGTGRGFQLGLEVGGAWTSQEEPRDFGSDAFWLRLKKVGNTYTQWYSTNGTDFLQANGQTVYGDGTPGKVGLVAMVDWREETHALIDYFEVTSPEPGGTEGTVVRDDFDGNLKGGILFLSETTNVRQRFYRVRVDLF